MGRRGVPSDFHCVVQTILLQSRPVEPPIDMKRQRIPRGLWGRAHKVTDGELGARWRREIGRVLRAVRLARKISVLELCEAGKLNRPTIKRIEDGSGNYMIDSLLTVCLVLRVPPSELLATVAGRLINSVKA